MSQPTIEGYWKPQESDGVSPYPFPIPNKFTHQRRREAFIQKLQHIQETGTDSVAFRGFSPCRLCDNEQNGSQEYTSKDGLWTWPEGYIHYVRDHQVMPSPEFLKWVEEDERVAGGDQNQQKDECVLF
eukprot:TRINITY_DN740_c0_g1_i1.p1 TRINITY_DN740_c0_g1~~TRINITY_DN740_c0_g1_i1.p1  ORF type:complete len:128 (+),score=20.42 TRINITY_DN740_c0_g1_i1:116-499(+)